MSAVAGLRGLALQAELLTFDSSAGENGTGCLLLTVQVPAHHCACAGHIATTEQCLQRLVLGGVKLAVVLQATTAEQAVKHQHSLAQHCLPQGVTVVTAQPRALAACLRQVHVSDASRHLLLLTAQSTELCSVQGNCRKLQRCPSSCCICCSRDTRSYICMRLCGCAASTDASCPCCGNHPSTPLFNV